MRVQVAGQFITPKLRRQVKRKHLSWFINALVDWFTKLTNPIHIALLWSERHMSPRWGFRAGFALFTIHIPPRWGFKTYQCRSWKNRPTEAPSHFRHIRDSLIGQLFTITQHNLTLFAKFMSILDNRPYSRATTRVAPTETEMGLIGQISTEPSNLDYVTGHN